MKNVRTHSKIATPYVYNGACTRVTVEDVLRLVEHNVISFGSTTVHHGGIFAPGSGLRYIENLSQRRWSARHVGRFVFDETLSQSSTVKYVHEHVNERPLFLCRRPTFRNVLGGQSFLDICEREKKKKGLQKNFR
uniref:Uncharacterized protein n=1 Tax=Sipha flava TaxID=143950 RepID=A0A2S2R1H8_9HEMI